MHVTSSLLFWCVHAHCLSCARCTNPNHTATCCNTLTCTVSCQVASRTNGRGAIHKDWFITQVPRSKGVCVAVCCSVVQCSCVAVDQRFVTQVLRPRSVYICSVLHFVAVQL